VKSEKNETTQGAAKKLRNMPTREAVSTYKVCLFFAKHEVPNSARQNEYVPADLAAELIELGFGDWSGLFLRDDKIGQDTGGPDVALSFTE